MTSHASELRLRQLFAGEAVDPSLKAHTDSCDVCRAKLRGLEEEQRKFEAAIPFERFAAGVERAGRQPRQVVAVPERKWMRYAMAIAATVLVVASGSLLLKQDVTGNRIKGSAGIDIVVAGASNGPQRAASADPATPEPLAPGERVRIGYRAGQNHYLIAVSVDERGDVTTYPESGTSLAINGSSYLPDSVEFTGHGLERVVVVLSPEPLQVDEVRRAVRVRFDEARGNVAQLGSLDLPGDQFPRTFLKP